VSVKPSRGTNAATVPCEPEARWQWTQWQARSSLIGALML
jgi:hypothetical protein